MVICLLICNYVLNNHLNNDDIALLRCDHYR